MDAKKFKKFLVFLSASIFLGLIFVPGYITLAQLKDRNRQLIAGIRQLEKINDELEEEISLLEKDKEYIEKIAREKLGLTKEGEIIYKIEE